MRITLGLAAALIAAPAFAQTTTQTTTAPQVGERTAAPAAAAPARTADGPLVVAESACLKRLQQSIPQLRSSLQGEDRRDLRRMNDTAIIFAKRGNETGCQTIAAEMERMATGARTAAGTQAVTDRRTRVSSARALEGQTASMQNMIDSEVVAIGGEEIGEIEDIVIIHGPQPRAYAIVDRDSGWFDIGADSVAVPLGQLRSIEGDEYAVAITEKAFDELPAMDRSAIYEARSYEGIERGWTAQVR